MEISNDIINRKLLPLSWLYGLAVSLRNLLFETNVLKSKSYKTPVISVGNITVGGTGKTPHVEYLVRLLRDKARVAVLSRGYKRKSCGYVLAGKNTKVSDIGDEPFQMKQKFPDVTVAVDKKRTRGIERLISDKETKQTDVILLDDAFQHRYVKPGINILLVDYHQMILQDTLLPAGRLREPLSSKNRADIVIVTKCPTDLKPMDYRVLTKQMNLFPYQQLYFTTIDYELLKPVFPEDASQVTTLSGYNVLLLTGIASPRPLQEALTPQAASLRALRYADHHHFTPKDIERITQEFLQLPTPRLIVTTEKDAVRLKATDLLPAELRQSLYQQPIHVSFMLDQENKFNETIIGYVRKNSRNSILAKKKDDNTPQHSHHSGDRPRTISFRNN